MRPSINPISFFTFKFVGVFTLNNSNLSGLKINIFLSHFSALSVSLSQSLLRSSVAFTYLTRRLFKRVTFTNHCSIFFPLLFWYFLVSFLKKVAENGMGFFIYTVDCFSVFFCIPRGDGCFCCLMS